MLPLTLYTTSGCHLCEHAEAILEQGGHACQAVDIADDLSLMEQYGVRIPVVKDASGRELGWPFDGTQLEANCLTYDNVKFASGDAGELLARNPRSFDIVDVDSFGLSGDPALAIQAASDGGVILIATTGAAAAGARGKAARAALKKRLGCAACKTPAQNELGLRMLLGAAARAASKDGAVLRPLFCHYAAHRRPRRGVKLRFPSNRLRPRAARFRDTRS